MTIKHSRKNSIAGVLQVHKYASKVLPEAKKNKKNDENIHVRINKLH